MLAVLGGRLFHDAFARDNTPEDMEAYLGQHFTEAALERILADPACHVLVLEDASVPVGWALLVAGTAAPRSAAGVGRDLLSVGREVEIRRFYVEGRHHGGEAATALMLAALGRARALGADGLWLAVWERNGRAQAFYAKHGFRRVGTQAFQFGTDTQTDDVLSRPLSFGVSLAIVAGGGATRLGGVCKPLLRVGRRTVLARLLALRTLADEVLLVSADPRLPEAGMTRVLDALPGRGAPGGVQTAMARASAPWVLAVAGDMPFVDGRAVLPLLEARRDDLDAVAYRVAGRLEPLAAVYRSSLAPRWASALSGGGASFGALWEGLRGMTLPESVLREATGDTRAVVSLNAPADLATWVDAPPDPRSQVCDVRGAAATVDRTQAMAKPFDRAVSGFNHNITHAGRVFHVQTEDSGVNNPNIITHLFVGGNILASKKTSYAELLKAENLQELVRQLMEDQHKQMLRNVVQGVYDTLDATARAYQPGQLAPAGDARSDGSKRAQPRASLPPEVEAARSMSTPPQINDLGAQTLFGEDLISEKSLDEVILNYLAGDGES